VAQRQQQQAANVPAQRLHPLNYAVLAVLPLTEACWVFEHGQRAGFRYSDAQTVLDWHNVPADVRKRLPIAVNAILRG
jgi:hypothetical protein